MARAAHLLLGTICATLLLLFAGVASAQDRTPERPPSHSHRVAIHVDDNDAKVMNLALNNAKNVVDYYQRSICDFGASWMSNSLAHSSSRVPSHVVG